MILAAIVVVDLKNGIGRDNKLLAHLPGDLKFFKATTMGHPIIMGRKTYESIGKLLPGRKNIVITRKTDYILNGAEIYHSVDAALKSCVADEKIFIIGGAEIFNQALPMIREIYRTVIKSEFVADTFFPEISETEFALVWSECHHADEKNKFDYCFEKWVRKVK